MADEAAVLAIADIDSCFDRVRWDIVGRAATAHRFPLSIIVLALSMYAARRRLKWSEAHSTAACATR